MPLKKTPEGSAAQIPPQPLTVQEFLRWAKIGRTLFYSLLKAGKGPRVAKLGSATRIRQEEAQRWLASLEG